MEQKFSNELEAAIKKTAKERGIILVSEKIMSASAFLKAEKKNKLRAPTVCYILPDGTNSKKLSEEERKELSEFAAIVDMEGEFFFVVFIYKD